jgi:tetratricopeptide (TPR) repeat protein
LFKFAVNNGDQFETARVKRFCLTSLPAYPQGIAAFEKQFGALSSFERERIHALVAERRHDLNAARKHWANCVEHLVTARNSVDNALKAALILRRMADLQMQWMGPDPWDEAVQDELARSLELDPKDKETYLKLLGMARQRDDRKAQDQWVEKAVRQFPEDAEVLLAAGLSAYRRRAFKKAAGFAQTLLERDPINPHARNLLISCHLAHARKQIKAGKYDLAGRELAAAGQFVREEEQCGIVALNQGFLAQLDGREPESETLLRQGLKYLGSGLVAEFRFMVDGRRLEIAQSMLSKQYNRLQDKPLPPTRQEILTLAELLHRYVDDGVKDISQVLDRLRVPLKTAATLDFTEQELEMVCAALSKARHYLLLKVYAEAAMKRCGQRPKFLYYYVFGRTKGQETKITALERIQLQGALDRALDAEDHQTAAHIEKFLGLPDFGPTGMPPMSPQAAQDLQQIFAELMERLNTDNPEDVLDYIEERMEAGELPPFPLPLPRGRRR